MHLTRLRGGDGGALVGLAVIIFRFSSTPVIALQHAAFGVHSSLVKSVTERGTSNGKKSALPITLVASVPDRSLLKDDIQVSAQRVGNAAATRSRNPSVFRCTDISS
jgi:hypothetical protein